MAAACVAGDCLLATLKMIICGQLIRCALTLSHWQVWMPWAHLVIGEAQFSTMMAFLWENMYEPCSYGPAPPPLNPIGVPRPPQPQQPERLGVDKSQPVTWQCELNVRSLVGLCEGLNTLAPANGTGPAVGKVCLMMACHWSWLWHWLFATGMLACAKYGCISCSCQNAIGCRTWPCVVMHKAGADVR